MNIEEIINSRHASRGVKVVESLADTPAYDAEIRSGDFIIAIDGEIVTDSIDVQFLGAEAEFEVLFRREAEFVSTVVTRDEGSLHGIIVEDPPIRECANICPFCFVDQNPINRNLRPGLEIRDDDYRYSFLYGHYVTLTNLTRRDLERIMSMKLSPLYVSVHATDPATRATLLGRKDAPILPLLNQLRDGGIQIHTQIVLIPGLNDGEIMAQTVEELYKLRTPQGSVDFRGISSVAVIPVGLTNFHHKGVASWTKETTSLALESILEIGRNHPTGFLQAADEWFSMVGQDPPPIDYYGGMEVEENGVGMVRNLLDQWAAAKLPKKAPKRSCAVVTGASPSGYISKITNDLNRIEGIDLELCVAENKTFGSSVTVTGLLGWNDIKDAVVNSTKPEIVIPDVVLDGYNRFLDGPTVSEAEKEISKKIQVVSSNAQGFLEIIPGEN